MKKIIIIMSAGLGIVSSTFYAQTFSYNTGTTQPVPSVSSLNAYTNMPVSLQTGIPNISYDLMSVPANNSAVNISMGISYHAGNITRDPWVGDLGSGWSLIGQGVISREVNQDPDESFDDAGTSFYYKNDFNDIYDYNIPGESGRFRFIRNTNDNSFKLVMLTGTTSKVKYYRTDNMATLILDSFVITTDRGIKYKFELPNITSTTVWKGGYPNLGATYGRCRYKSAFMLTSILDENDLEVAKFNYTKYYTYSPNGPVPEEEINKLSRIDIKDRGIIELSYEEKATLGVRDDKYKLTGITQKTTNNQFVSKYTFDLEAGSLKSYNKIDKDGNLIEKTKFEYQPASIITSYPIGEGTSYTSPLMYKIHVPTGGLIEYNFELLPLGTRNIYRTVTPESSLGSVAFSSFSTSKKYMFTLTEDSDVNIESPIGTLSGFLWNFAFFKKVGNSFQPGPGIGNAAMENPNDPDAVAEKTKITLTAGEYYVSLTTLSPGGNIPEISFNAFRITGQSYEVSETVADGVGLPRIKKIKYYNAADSVFLSDPAMVEDYSYNWFDNNTTSSGTVTDMGNPLMIYKNVKVSKGSEGYIQYYFKNPNDYTSHIEQSPLYPGLSYMVLPNFNLLRDGILVKKEIYNAAGQKQAEDVFDYLMEEYDTMPYPMINDGTDTGYVKTGWMKNETISSRNYFASGFAETKKEVTRNNTNYKTQLERVTSFDGSIQETTYQYALDKNNQKLINANIIGIPLETTSIIKKNVSDVGKLMSRAETKYDNPANKFPSSAVSYDTQNNLSEEVTFNRYDSKGNLEQYTTKEGIPVSVVWGYSKTQPIAKIEGATYDQISTYIADIISKSDADIDVSSEQSFQSALDLFRNNSALGTYQITTYVYDPLIGMKSMTPPSGIREMYQYDKAGRLDQIVDEKGKVLKKYKYNYKQ